MGIKEKIPENLLFQDTKEQLTIISERMSRIPKLSSKDFKESAIQEAEPLSNDILLHIKIWFQHQERLWVHKETEAEDIIQVLVRITRWTGDLLKWMLLTVFLINAHVSPWSVITAVSVTLNSFQMPDRKICSLVWFMRLFTWAFQKMFLQITWKA